MIDIHCHILPGIDDGAKDPAMSEVMLAAQADSGVHRLFLTPHFYPEEMPLDEFLAARDSAWGQLAPRLRPEDPQLRLGAEVRYCRQLLELDLRKVTLGDSDYLLLELPGRYYPSFAVQILEELQSQGIIPILAHVERCAYFREDPRLLKRLIDAGALAQVSASALFDRKDKNFACACLEHGLAHMAASDAHNLTGRRPCMDALNRLPDALRQIHDVCCEAVWNNELPPYMRTAAVKKTFFGYR